MTAHFQRKYEESDRDGNLILSTCKKTDNHDKAFWFPKFH